MVKVIIQSVIYLMLLVPAILFGQHNQRRKPDMKTIFTKASENFKKALAESKTFNKINAQRITNVLDYTQIPVDARIPGQFEENQAVAITWQYLYDADYNATNVVADETNPLGKIACSLAEKIQLSNAKVIIRVKAATDSIAVKNIMIARGTPLTNYSFYVHPIDSFWDRDSGPISFYYGEQDNIGMIDMDYYTLAAVVDNSGNVNTDFATINASGRINDDLIPVVLGTKFGYPVYKTPLNDEGGNIISDGLGKFWGSDGTRAFNTQVQDGTPFGQPGISLYANYPLTTQTDFNTLFTNSFKINSHLETEVFSCDGGTGHIDIYAKLLDENNLILADYAPAINHTDYAKWNANLLLLQNTVDSNGKPMTIRLVPMPRIANGSVQTECEIAPLTSAPDQRTYVNGIFVNKNYLMPIQSDPSNPIPSDVAAIAAFQIAMPGYTISPINFSSFMGFGGALHCITMQIPAENPVFIRHNALTGNQPLLSTYPLDTFIKNKSGLASKFIYYRKSGQTTWIALPLNAGTTANNYTASIPGTGFANGDIIEYFIEATSNNGKTISKPFTAREGGFYKFTIGGNLASNRFDVTTNFALSLYPNPNNGSFTLPISLDSQKNISIEIFDTLGRTIFSKKMELNSGLTLNEIDLQSIGNAGVYIVKTTANGVLLKNQRLVIK